MIRLTARDGKVFLTLLSPSRRKDHTPIETDYAVEIVTPTWGWRVKFTKSNGEEHAVTLDGIGWRCDCKAYIFAGGYCKHVSAAVELRDVLGLLSQNSANLLDSARVSG